MDKRIVHANFADEECKSCINHRNKRDSRASSIANLRITWRFCEHFLRLPGTKASVSRHAAHPARASRVSIETCKQYKKRR